MYWHNCDKLFEGQTGEEILQKVEELQEKEGYRAVCDYLLDLMPVQSLPIFRDEYFARVAAYNKALIYSKMGMGDKASDIYSELELSSAGDYNELLFFDHARLAKKAGEHQKQAIERDIPYFFLISQPKSGSATLSQSISNILDIPVLRTSSPYVLIKYWLSMFLQGGAVTHDHFSASRFNIDLLEGSGVDEIFVQIRDPRDSAFSMLNMLHKHERREAEFSTYKEFKEHCLVFIEFIHTWLEYFESMERKVKMHWIKFDELKNDLNGTTRKVLTLRLGEQRVKELGLDDNIDAQLANANRSDSKQGWRDYLSDEQREEIWGLIPEGVKALLDLSA